MSNQKMAIVAKLVPTQIEELADCEIPENVQKQYGERLIKNINAYIEQENLLRFIQNRPKKKLKTTMEADDAENKPILIHIQDSDDEFDDGIDYAAINLPTGKPSEDLNSLAERIGEKINPFNLNPSVNSIAKPGSKLRSKKSSYFYSIPDFSS